MDWTQYFVDFMEKVPGGYVILGIIGAAVCISPFIPKVLNTYKNFKNLKEEEKQKEEEKRQKEEEERLEQIAEDREFRKKVTTIMETLPEMTDRIESLSETAQILRDANEKSGHTHDCLAQNIKSLEGKMDKLDEKMEKIEKASSSGDEMLRSSINDIKTDLRSVTGQVNLIVESDLDDFRSYLIDVHNKHVYAKEPMTKRDIEILCLKFKKYTREGGNGWAKKLYFEILQCETTDGERAEDVARQFHLLIDSTTDNHHQAENHNNE